MSCSADNTEEISEPNSSLPPLPQYYHGDTKDTDEKTAIHEE